MDFKKYLVELEVTFSYLKGKFEKHKDNSDVVRHVNEAMQELLSEFSQKVIEYVETTTHLNPLFANELSGWDSHFQIYFYDYSGSPFIDDDDFDTVAYIDGIYDRKKYDAALEEIIRVIEESANVNSPNFPVRVLGNESYMRYSFNASFFIIRCEPNGAVTFTADDLSGKIILANNNSVHKSLWEKVQKVLPKPK